MPPDIEFDDPAWGAAGGLNGQPPLILADLPPEVRTIIEQLVGVLGISGNLGVPTDNLDAETGQLERDTMTATRRRNFPAARRTRLRCCRRSRSWPPASRARSAGR